MHDALIARIHIIELNAELSAVLAQRGDLYGGDLVHDVEPALDGRGHIVVDGGDATVGAADRTACQAQTFEMPAAR
jgi:hypothetical protein